MISENPSNASNIASLMGAQGALSFDDKKYKILPRIRKMHINGNIRDNIILSVVVLRSVKISPQFVNITISPITDS